MIETRTIVIAKCEVDHSWGIRQLWAADGSGYCVHERDFYRVGDACKIQNGTIITGYKAKFELVDGRWLLARLEVGEK